MKTTPVKNFVVLFASISTSAFISATAQATLTPTLPRGEQIIQRSAQEICVIPKKLSSNQTADPSGAQSGAKYSESDKKNEVALCNTDINGSTQNTAVCGKTTSTNPSVEFFSVPTGMTPAQVEAKNCTLSKTEDPNDESSKVAKYKNSTSCSYTPSILSYYHVSRFFGNVNQVPVSVLRTMDMNRHQQVGKKTVAHLRATGKGGDLIVQTWQSLLNYLAKGSASAKKDVLMTDDFKQSYGALVKNPKGEAFYKEMFQGGANQVSRTANFRDRNPTFQLLKSANETRSFVGTQFNTANVQKILQMKNISDMIIMDTILSQEDRLGNIDFNLVYYFIENGQVKKEKKLKPEEIQAKGAVQVKDLMMNDNDCGVNRTNHFKAARLVESLRHVHPETYHQLQKLNSMLGTEETKLFFKRETMMTDSDYANFQANVKYVSTVLKQSCQNAKLKLDLDLDAHFANVSVNTSCE